MLHRHFHLSKTLVCWEFWLTFLLSFYTLNTILFSSSTIFLFTFAVSCTWVSCVDLLYRRCFKIVFIFATANNYTTSSQVSWFHQKTFSTFNSYLLIDGLIRHHIISNHVGRSFSWCDLNFPYEVRILHGSINMSFIKLHLNHNLFLSFARCESVCQFTIKLFLMICWRLVLHRRVDLIEECMNCWSVARDAFGTIHK